MKNLLTIVLAAALVCVLPVAASAQTIIQNAQFSLPFSASWGDKILPPGDYTISVARVSSDRDVVYRVTFTGQELKHTILALNKPGPVVAKSSVLVAKIRGREISLRELHLTNANLVLTFPEPQKNPTVMARNTNPQPEVPILIAVK